MNLLLVSFLGLTVLWRLSHRSLNIILSEHPVLPSAYHLSIHPTSCIVTIVAGWTSQRSDVVIVFSVLFNGYSRWIILNWIKRYCLLITGADEARSSTWPSNIDSKIVSSSRWIFWLYCGAYWLTRWGNWSIGVFIKKNITNHSSIIAIFSIPYFFHARLFINLCVSDASEHLKRPVLA